MQTPASYTSPTEVLGAVILALYTEQVIHALKKEQLSLEVEEDGKPPLWQDSFPVSFSRHMPFSKPFSNKHSKNQSISRLGRWCLELKWQTNGIRTLWPPHLLFVPEEFLKFLKGLASVE